MKLTKRALVRKPRKKRAKRKSEQPTELSQRLIACSELGNMTTQDVATFLCQPYMCVYTWMFQNATPYRHNMRVLEPRLKVLEALVKGALRPGGKKTLIPRNLRMRERAEYVRRLRNSAVAAERAVAE